MSTNPTKSVHTFVITDFQLTVALVVLLFLSVGILGSAGLLYLGLTLAAIAGALWAVLEILYPNVKLKVSLIP